MSPPAAMVAYIPIDPPSKSGGNIPITHSIPRPMTSPEITAAAIAVIFNQSRGFSTFFSGGGRRG